jgi:hypothetical protein
MKMKVILLCTCVLLFVESNAQLVQTTVKTGAQNNEVVVYMKPDFSSSTEYLFQLQFTVAFPATVVPLPSGISVTLHPSFVSTFVGSTYNVVVNAMGNNTGNTEKYFPVTLTRNAGSAAANSAPQTWAAGTEYPVMTVRFNSVGAPAQAQVKIADYQDQGSDGQGNTFAVSGTGTYYYDMVNSAANFYATAGQSEVGGTTAAGFVRTLSLVTLPVNLLNFSGYKSGSKNVLKWNTSTESGNLGFEVQRSSDGVNYSAIGFVNSLAAGGNSNTELSYTFEDNNPVVSKKNYYRLNQKNADGKSKMSNVVVISGEKPTTIGIGGIFPNPASSTVNVIIDAPRRDDVTVVLMDVLGKTIKQKVVNVEIGSNTVPVEISSLASGSYLVKVLCKSSDCETAVSKFIKQ